MSRSMSAPWIQTMIKNILVVGQPGNDSNENQVNSLGKGKVVQVIGVNTILQCITVSDKNHSIHVFLTPQCVDFIENINNYSLADLKYCQVKIEQYHLSTAAQCASHRDLFSVSRQISFPFALQCNKLTYLGANDCDIIGEPAKEILPLRQCSYGYLYDLLSNQQFPHQKQLPSIDGFFTRPRYISDTNPLCQEMCQWHRNEIAEFKEITSFNHAEIVEIKRRYLSSRQAPHPNPNHLSNDINVTNETLTSDDWDDIPVHTNNQNNNTVQLNETEVPSPYPPTASSSADKRLGRGLDPTGDYEIEILGDDEEVLTQAQTVVTQPPLSVDNNTRNEINPIPVIADFVGRKVRKDFKSYGIFDGVIKSFDGEYYFVVYSDGDREELTFREISKILVVEESQSQSQYSTSNNNNNDVKKNDSSSFFQQDNNNYPLTQDFHNTEQSSVASSVVSKKRNREKRKNLVDNNTTDVPITKKINIINLNNNNNNNNNNKKRSNGSVSIRHEYDPDLDSVIPRSEIDKLLNITPLSSNCPSVDEPIDYLNTNHNNNNNNYYYYYYNNNGNNDNNYNNYNNGNNDNNNDENSINVANSSKSVHDIFKTMKEVVSRPGYLDRERQRRLKINQISNQQLSRGIPKKK